MFYNNFVCVSSLQQRNALKSQLNSNIYRLCAQQLTAKKHQAFTIDQLIINLVFSKKNHYTQNLQIENRVSFQKK